MAKFTLVTDAKIKKMINIVDIDDLLIPQVKV